MTQGQAENREFWIKKWQGADQGFQLDAPHPLMVQEFPAPFGEGVVFVPLCGATCDIKWLLDEGWTVIGAELSEVAVKKLFLILGLEPKLTTDDNFTIYSAPKITIFVGDVFDLTSDHFSCDIIYDRAALVALSPRLRRAYARHLLNIAPRAEWIIIALEFEESLIKSPPFHVDHDEMSHLFGGGLNLEVLASVFDEKMIKDAHAGKEVVWRVSHP